MVEHECQESIRSNHYAIQIIAYSQTDFENALTTLEL